jgi:hypothetical protein
MGIALAAFVMSYVVLDLKKVEGTFGLLALPLLLNLSALRKTPETVSN